MSDTTLFNPDRFILFTKFTIMGLILSSASSLLMLGMSILPVHPNPGNNNVMWTEQSTIFKGESLTLQFITPHDKHLGVINPDGEFFYVIFPSASSSGNLRPFMDSNDFVEKRSIKINTTTFKADPYRYGVLDNQAVFTKTGTYRFVLGDNLSVHDENRLSILKIEYKHTPRPANLGRDVIRA
jgi:hypothetical protein